MTPVRRTAASLAVAGLLLACPTPLAGAAHDPPGRASAEHVVVVGVPGLTWADVDAERTPELWALAGESSIGALSVRAARSTTCLLDGWATLGAGNRARVPGPDEVPPQPSGGTALAHCAGQERTADVALDAPADVVARIAAEEGTVRFGAEPGALGAVVGCAAVSGRAATLAVAAPDVDLTTVDPLPHDPAELAGVLDGCPLGLVSLDDLTDAGEPGPRKTDDGTEPALRRSALDGIDTDVGRVRAAVAALPGETLLLVTGISEVNDGRSQLHVAMASGPGFRDDAWLTSASTGRPPFVQLIDVAPTVLGALGAVVPPSMNGSPFRVGGDRPALATAVADLVRANTAATVHHRTTGSFFWLLVAVVAAVVVLGVLVLERPARAAGPWSRRILRNAAVVAAALPVGTYLAGLAPWEAAGSPLLALSAAVVAGTAVVSVLALAGPWRRHRFGPPLTVLGLTLLTLVADVLTGSALELDGLLGYDAVVAGRFTGYGNLTFGLLAVSGLIGTAAAATALARRAGPARARAVTAVTVVGAGLLAVVLVGAPDLGRDFGGVLAVLPGFLLLAMLLTGIRVTAVRLGAVLAAAVLAVATVAVLDWRRPPGERTHLGRFVEQVRTGDAWTVVLRKAEANLDILVSSPLAWLLPVAAVAGFWLLRRGGPLRGARGTGSGVLPPAEVGVLRKALIACALTLAVGAAVNDSGVAVPATAAALLVPLLVWLAAGSGSGGTAGGSPRSGPGEPTGRVTVVSRGSTVSGT